MMTEKMRIDSFTLYPSCLTTATVCSLDQEGHMRYVFEILVSSIYLNMIFGTTHILGNREESQNRINTLARSCNSSLIVYDIL